MMSDRGSSTTALYRFYGAGDELLYIGITNSIPRRLDQHSDTKPWYARVQQITVEHQPTRGAALAAEKAAIQAERPRYNIQHNRGAIPAEPKGESRWTFRSLRSGHERSTDLYLYGELDCSSMVDDYYELDGEGQVEEYVRYLRRYHPEWLDADAVPIYWNVVGNGTFEFAPFQTGRFATLSDSGPEADFLSYFSWPYDARTCERLDWFHLPVRNTRFPEFAEALGWNPSPLQPTCPLRSILYSRDGFQPP